MRSLRVLTAAVLSFASMSSAVAQTAPVGPPADGWFIPPVDGAIARPFLNPLGPFAAGHRGVDYAVPSGSLVRAAAAGRVTFAGPVANVRAVTIDHGDGVTTTYTSLGSTFVAEGDEVGQGEWIGRSARAHEGGPSGVHFGVRVDGAYVDPAAYLGPVGIAGAVHLAPLPQPPPEIPTTSLRDAVDALAQHTECRPPSPVDEPPAPNRNIVVAIAGIGSRTSDGAAPALYERVPELLGYSPASIYRFSYAGAGGSSFHEPYGLTDTFGDLRAAAGRLEDLLLRIARRSPGRRVDLIAHSEGGLVARYYLESIHDSWDSRLPVVDHLVTLSTPHQGAPLAGAIELLDESSISGRLLLKWMSDRARSGARWPDPLSTAVGQLAPGSDLIESLGREDVSFGTRVLALATPNDVVVPADRALLDNELSRVMDPAGLEGHSGIVTAAQSLGTAYAFLRDARDPCPTGWDGWGPRVGVAAGWVEERLPWLYAQVESAVTRRARFGLRKILQKRRWSPLQR